MLESESEQTAEACARCKQAHGVVRELQACLDQVVRGYDREIKRSMLLCSSSCSRLLPAPFSLTKVACGRLSKELDRARRHRIDSRIGERPADAASGPELISYGNIPGFSEEMRHLGDCYMQGIEGHARDADRAYKYYEAAAVHGCAVILWHV